MHGHALNECYRLHHHLCMERDFAKQSHRNAVPDDSEVHNRGLSEGSELKLLEVEDPIIASPHIKPPSSNVVEPIQVQGDKIILRLLQISFQDFIFIIM
ncbi:hypothetical protein IEQ34_004333 [Dendrobium chrysotoxum]|uniref:Uncharacterized protein n=1 Tax=Dendrobium chrysotoxum TaxID=161865 RepID=A0AAV7HG10_DENCH|nr:hypothetical protein IEQ34_004333 [Dendrobium chrysotoxum]